MGLLRSWQPCHLLLTKEGSVHCYDAADTAQSSPAWSGRRSTDRKQGLGAHVETFNGRLSCRGTGPLDGAVLSVDESKQTLTLYPAREWLKQRWRLTVRMVPEARCLRA